MSARKASSSLGSKSAPGTIQASHKTNTVSARIDNCILVCTILRKNIYLIPSGPLEGSGRDSALAYIFYSDKEEMQVDVTQPFFLQEIPFRSFTSGYESDASDKVHLSLSHTYYCQRYKIAYVIVSTNRLL